MRERADKCLPRGYLFSSDVCRRRNVLSRQLEAARGGQLETPASVLDMREDGFTRILGGR